MSFPSSTGSRKSLTITYTAAKILSARIKQQTVDARDAAAAGTLRRFRTLEYMTNLTDAFNDFAIYRAIPGLLAYAKDQESTPALNILNEMDTMTDAITAVRDWIVVNYPVDPSGFLLTYTITGGRFADTGLSAALAAPLLPFLDTLIASID